jgi:hypothetical protein
MGEFLMPAKVCLCKQKDAEIAKLRERIQTLEAENERLAKMFAGDVYIESAHLEPGHYDMRLRGKGAMLLAGQIIKMFRDSGGENFLTNTMAYEFGDPVTRELYELTVQKVDGEDSPAQKIQRLQSACLTYEIAIQKFDFTHVPPLTGEELEREARKVLGDLL